MRVENLEFVKRLVRKQRNSGTETPYRCHKTNDAPRSPTVSIVLLDWDCRESLHTLDWLQRQDVPRGDYEIIWIDLYDRVVPEAMEKADVVVTLEQRGMYHKHVGYNVGALLARGEIVTICDSDAVFPADFIQSVVTSFTQSDRDELRPLVLMHHELRTSLTYPDELSDAEVLKDAERWKWWPLNPNAGACMSVRKQDVLRFGGFDEHSSYSGYLCGPYDLGWRLVNAGLPEVWHATDTVLWHFAHPDPIGTNGLVPSVKQLFENTFPHVDLHAITAVEHFSSGRILPLTENSTIHQMRMANREIGTEFERNYAELSIPQGFTRWHFAVLRFHLLFDLVTSAFLARPIQRIIGRLRRSNNPLVRHVRNRISIWRHRNGLKQERLPRLVTEFKNANVVAYDNHFYSVPKMLGPIDFDDSSQRSHPEIVRRLSLEDASEIASAA